MVAGHAPAGLGLNERRQAIALLSKVYHVYMSPPCSLYSAAEDEGAKSEAA